MAKNHTVSSLTALPLSPQDARHNRMAKYLIAMGVRLVCIAMCFVVSGWWLAVFALAAVVLPYFAVVLANVGYKEEGVVLRPGSIVPVAQREQPADAGADR